ncbi:MAG: dTMP kinase [Hyphomonadaceae bacterium]|nr:dTMP kinase [Hyphomonadaceae bacterium]
MTHEHGGGNGWDMAPVPQSPLPGTGLFVTFEGGEGAGKSTLVRALAVRMAESGYPVDVTREPGGTPGAEDIRALLVTGEPERWTAATEVLLFYAARQDHLERRIRPALAVGTHVLCDRFSDSTRAYQGVAGGTGPALVEALDALVVGSTRPDLTLILDLDPALGLARAASRGGHEARFEARAVAFHGALRDAYHQIARNNPDRCVLIDAAASPPDVLEAAWQVLSARLEARKNG